MDRLLLTLIALVVLASGAALADLPGLETQASGSWHYSTESSPPDSALSDHGWRRTTRGWEHESAWRLAPVEASRSPVTRISPILVGVLQLLAAAGMLLLFDKRPIATRSVSEGPFRS